MAELLELIENIKQEDASTQKLFNNEGTGAKHIKKGTKYLESLAAAAKLVADVYSGKKPARRFMEAMTTDDFPFLFGDVLDRQLLANYLEYPSTFRNFCKIGTVNDFRTVRRLTTSGSEGSLSVVNEQAEYPETSIGEARYSYAVKKYGRRIPFSWETMINDDLDALKDMPARLGRAARRTEQKFATDLYCGTAGPDGTFYASGNSNIVTSNPALSTSALQTAMTILAAQTDSDSEPIFIDAIHLVVPPALEITALNIMNALEIRLETSGGGISAQKLDVVNWMKNRVKLSVDPYIPIIASSSNGSTSWFLFADPNNGRPALEVGFLRGHTTPEIFIKAPNAQAVGGGGVNPMNGDFDTDSIQYKVRHVLGGILLDPKMSVASNGSGS